MGTGPQLTRSFPVSIAKERSSDSLELRMELELGLALPSHHLAKAFDLNDESSSSGSCQKRGFDEAFEEMTTLPLFANNDGNEDRQQLENPHEANNASKVVGWPPIKPSRRKSGSAPLDEKCSSMAKCVKVKMEGVAIGRKVNLSLHDSYEALFRTLGKMFPKPNDWPQQQHYTVTYEDGDGDWMLVGDVPWGSFIRSVKRLKVLN